MSEVVAGSAFIPHHCPHLPLPAAKWKDQLFKPSKQWHVVTQPKWYPVIVNQMVKPSTYTSRISTNLPLYESPGALFDEYLEDKPRVFEAIFPDKRRSQRINEAQGQPARPGRAGSGPDLPPGPSISASWFRPTSSTSRPCWQSCDPEKSISISYCLCHCFHSFLPHRLRPFLVLVGMESTEAKETKEEEEWRIQMLPVQFLFLTVWPVIDMRLRCKSGGRDYPSGVPCNITKVLELDIIRWELGGLDDFLKPSHFSLGVKGALYPERQVTQSRLKGQLEMSISFVVPPVLALVPEDGLQSVAESVLKRLVENMKDKVNGSLLADYNKFRKQKAKNVV